MNETLQKWYKEHSSEVTELAKKIWSNPEASLEEYYACKTVSDFLLSYGFEVEAYNCYDASKPANAIIATWGSGRPVIGFIGEYDALPGLGQEAVPYRSLLEGYGHGCGHSLMSPAGASAAIALKAVIKAEGLEGTVKFFGCPAEEIAKGKLLMAADGKFNGLDCCMAWHPEPRNLRIREFVQNSNAHVLFEFFGKSSHAASAPEQGRSALDACELMNVGVNYLREHMDLTSRIHYTYKSAGEQPNVVPNYASTFYYVRAKNVKDDIELLERVKDCAKGAALMTGTECKISVISMTCGCVQIGSFNQFFYNSIMKIPPLTYTPEEEKFAAELFKNVNGRIPTEEESLIFTDIDAPSGIHPNSPGSTDAGYITHLVPTSRLHGWGMVAGTPMHSWGAVASVGSPLGIKACLHAGMAQAQCGYDILKNPKIVEEWQEDLKQQNKQDDVSLLIFPQKLENI